MKFFIDQHGCAKNQTDGELIAGFLMERGYEFTLNADEADFILVNSCGFIQSAKKESIDAVCNIKQAYPKAKLVLTGCLAERYADQLIEQMPELDGVFGNGDLSKIADFMDGVKKKRGAETFPQKGVCGGDRPVIFNFPGSAFVKITIIADSKSFDLDIGAAGQIFVEDIKWIKDTDGKYKLVVIELD